MHICFVIENLHPNPVYNLRVGGISNQILQLLPSYEKIKDITISIITKYSEYKAKTDRVNVYLISKFRHYSLNSLYFIIKSIFKLIILHRRNRIDIINIHTYSNILIIPFTLKFIFNIPIILKLPIDFSSHLSDILKLKKKQIRGKITNIIWFYLFKSIILRKINIIRVINDLMYKQLLNLKFPKERILKAPNGISLSKLKNIKKSENEEIHFGYVGRLSEFKNLKLMMNVFKVYFKKSIKDKLFIYGEGPEEEYLQNFITKNNLANNIYLMGYKKNKEEIFTNLDVLIDPAFAQGISNANLEAMSTKTLVIASNVSGNKDLIINGRTGLLFNPYDEEDLLKKLFFYKNNPNIVEEIMNQAYKEISLNYDIDKITSRICNFLKKKIKSRNYLQ